RRAWRCGGPSRIAADPDAADPDAAEPDAAGPFDACVDDAGLDASRPARRRRWVVATVVVGLVLAVVGTLVALHSRSAPPAHGGVGTVEPVADGSDPNRAGCGSGAVTLARVNLHFPAATLAGQLELRY